MELEIIEYPDRRLREISKEVANFDASLHATLDAMYEKMIASHGIGLAAIQVALPLRLLLINLPDENEMQTKENLLEIINPRITYKDGTTTYQEGCLSVPEFFEDVQRYESITLEYCNRYGECQTLEASGLLSIALQHEIDHLNGVLFIDKLSYARRKKFEKEYKRAQKERKTIKKSS
ncbi:MAG: peptide deformylase [Sulfuricurvum sp.]